MINYHRGERKQEPEISHPNDKNRLQAQKHIEPHTPELNSTDTESTCCMIWSYKAMNWCRVKMRVVSIWQVLQFTLNKKGKAKWIFIAWMSAFLQCMQCIGSMQAIARHYLVTVNFCCGLPYEGFWGFGSNGKHKPFPVGIDVMLRTEWAKRENGNYRWERGRVDRHTGRETDSRWRDTDQKLSTHGII